MTMLQPNTQDSAERHFQAATDLLADNVLNEWFNPEALANEENDALCQMLEALFAHGIEDKRDYPHELSELLRKVIGSNRLAFVLNGGDGSILSAFDPAFSYGVEPQEKRSRKRQGRYQTIVGNLNRLSKLFEPIDTKFCDTIVLLRDDTNTEDTLMFLNANLDKDMQVTYVIPHGQDAAILKTHPGVYAILELQEPTLDIYFATEPTRLKEEGARPPVETRQVFVNMLDLLDQWIKETRTKHLRYPEYRHQNTSYATTFTAAWRAIHREYGRRFMRDVRTYDIELVGKKIIDFQPSDWCKLAVDTAGIGDVGARIHKRDVSYFAQHSGLWRELLILEDEGVLLIDPLVKEAVAPVIETAARATTPLRPLKPQERLGYLSMQSKIKCVKDDEEAGFIAGKWYRVHLREEEYSKRFTKRENVKGVLQLVKKKRRYLHQRIVLDGRMSYYDDDPENIKYLLSHFLIPDPGDIRSRYPELVEAEEKRISALEEERLVPRGFRLKDYQFKDLAAICVQNRNILAHQQGLGKSVEGIMFALAAQKKTGKNLPVLLICPQDLIPQWQREAKEKYGIDLHWIGRHKGANGGSLEVEGEAGEKSKIAGGAIKNLLEARTIDKRIRNGEGGWYITHFEALTMGGARNLRQIEEPYVIRLEKVEKWIKGGWRTDPDTGHRRWFDSEIQFSEEEVTSADECPECGNNLYPRGTLVCNHRYKKHPNDPKATRCGWTRYIYRLPSIGQILSTTFANGVIIVDEGTQIASARNTTERDSSQKTKAVCGMRASHRLVMSGTPVKNFIAQAFWLLWWGIGNNSERFPYKYVGGKKKFADDYTVLEWSYNDESGNWTNVKEVGEVTNHTRLWAQLAAVLLRRIKEETGELIPKKETHIIRAPLGYYQREQMEYWLRHFPDFFAEKHPNDPKVKRGVHKNMAAMLGLDVKLNYAAVLPKTDQDWQWTNVPVSNWTPASYKTLTTIMALVKQGRRVLVGTDVRAASGWLAAMLNEKGIEARTMLNPSSGQTLDPPDRAKVVQEFQEGAMVALCSTQKAIRLGHNLDQGSAVVLLGLDWDYETYAQFTERVHRLTSKLPIDVYVIIPGEDNLTLIGRKWDVITDKAKGASMAIDGQLPDQNEDPVDIGAIIREMQEKGIVATGNEVREVEIHNAWAKLPQINQFEIPEDFTETQAKPWIIDWEAAKTAHTQHLQVVADWKAEEAEIAAANLAELDILCRATLIPAICDSLEAFFAGATAPLPEPATWGKHWSEDAGAAKNIVPIDTNFLDPSPVVAGEIEPEEASSAGSNTDEPEEPVTEPEAGMGVTPAVETEPEGDPYGDRATSSSLDIMGQIKQAKELHNLGILTDEEFATAKTDLLALLKAAA